MFDMAWIKSRHSLINLFKYVRMHVFSWFKLPSPT
jgi:hypothetical protein